MCPFPRVCWASILFTCHQFTSRHFRSTPTLLFVLIKTVFYDDVFNETNLKTESVWNICWTISFKWYFNGIYYLNKFYCFLFFIINQHLNDGIISISVVKETSTYNSCFSVLLFRIFYIILYTFFLTFYTLLRLEFLLQFFYNNKNYFKLLKSKA